MALPKIKGIFQSIGALENLPQKKIDELANRCILRKFDTNTLLIKQGSQTKYFCFIKNGFVKVNKNKRKMLIFVNRSLGQYIFE